MSGEHVGGKRKRYKVRVGGVGAGGFGVVSVRVGMSGMSGGQTGRARGPCRLNVGGSEPGKRRNRTFAARSRLCLKLLGGLHVARTFAMGTLAETQLAATLDAPTHLFRENRFTPGTALLPCQKQWILMMTVFFVKFLAFCAEHHLFQRQNTWILKNQGNLGLT